MVLSAVAVIFMTTEQSKEETTEALTNSYTVLRNDDDTQSGARMVGQSLVNALVIVCVIAAVTFIIVLLYKYRCMKFLIGYMLLASLLLLATMSARMWSISVERYAYPVDKITFFFVVYNFSVVGTYAVFLAQGIPKYITQSYLVLTAVFVAWEFSHFDNYTAWALLVMLALYDLYAVLTPYGPLQALVKLMQSPNAPPVPGLLYEANVGGGNSSRRQRRQSPDTTTNPIEQTNPPPERDEETTTNATEEAENPAPVDESQIENGQEEEDTQSVPADSSFEITLEQTENQPPSIRVEEARKNDESSADGRNSGPVDVDQVTEAENEQFTQSRRRIFQFDDSYPRLSIPMALAKLYRLPLEDNPNPLWLQPRTIQNDDDGATTPAPTYSVAELTSIVVAIAPPNGGVIRPHPEQIDGQETRYQVFDAAGQARRILFVNSTDGRIFEVHNYEEALEAHKKVSTRRESIRLGLGDFIFYSVLVSKAALHSWATFCASTLVILCGLGLTLLLLAWHGKALPALPISIFLGITFYLSTRYLLQPWIEEVFQETFYV